MKILTTDVIEFIPSDEKEFIVFVYDNLCVHMILRGTPYSINCICEKLNEVFTSEKLKEISHDS